MAGLLFAGPENNNWAEPGLAAPAQAWGPRMLGSPGAKTAATSWEAWFPAGFVGSQQQGHSRTPGTASQVWTHQSLNRAASPAGCMGFKIRDVIENISGKRLRVPNL